jgi:peptidoglycan/LPS O-acetylase OafA/YrhL
MALDQRLGRRACFLNKQVMMIGFYRLGLATAVVLVHFADLSWIAGRLAVYGFYFLSGYLISRAIDTYYLNDRFGLIRYAGNRFIRLAPLIVIFSGLAYLLVVVRGGGTFNLHESQRIFSDGPLKEGLNWFLFDLIARPELIRPWVIHFSSHLNNPLWSIGVEYMFYAVCPLLVLIVRQNALTVHIIAVLSIALSALIVYLYSRSTIDHNVAVYQNPLFSFSMFCIGVWFFSVTKGRQWFAKSWERTCQLSSALAIVLMGWYFVSQMDFDRWPTLGMDNRNARLEAYFYLSLPIIAGIGMLVVSSGVIANRGLARFDKFCANISYGVYLSHFSAAFLVLWLLESIGPSVRLGKWEFGLTVLAVAILLASAAYYLIEAPFDRLRALVRGSAAPGSLHSPSKRSFVMTLTIGAMVHSATD